MARLRPDPSFYASPTLAMEAPPEELAYVALLAPGGNGQRDAIGVVDTNPASPTYGRLVGRTDFPHGGNELHHFGWNACSSHLCPYAPNPHMERRYLVVPGHALVAHPHPRHQARSAAARAREGDRGRGGDGEDRLRRAAHGALRAGRHLHERARRAGRQRSRRHLHARPRDVRGQGPLGAGPRAAAPGLRLLVASRARHDDHQRVGHAEHGEGRREPGAAAGRQVRPHAARVGSAHAHATCRSSISAPSSRWCSSCGRRTIRPRPTASSASSSR